MQQPDCKSYVGHCHTTVHLLQRAGHHSGCNAEAGCMENSSSSKEGDLLFAPIGSLHSPVMLPEWQTGTDASRPDFLVNLPPAPTPLELCMNHLLSLIERYHLHYQGADH